MHLVTRRSTSPRPCSRAARTRDSTNASCTTCRLHRTSPRSSSPAPSARSGHTAAELQKVIDEELDRLRRDGPEAREVQRAINQMEASFYQRMERVGGFGGKADQS